MYVFVHVCVKLKQSSAHLVLFVVIAFFSRVVRAIKGIIYWNNKTFQLYAVRIEIMVASVQPISSKGASNWNVFAVDKLNDSVITENRVHTLNLSCDKHLRERKKKQAVGQEANKWLIALLWKVRALIIYSAESLSRLSDNDLAETLCRSICLHVSWWLFIFSMHSNLQLCSACKDLVVVHTCAFKSYSSSWWKDCTIATDRHNGLSISKIWWADLVKGQSKAPGEGELNLKAQGL